MSLKNDNKDYGWDCGKDSPHTANLSAARGNTPSVKAKEKSPSDWGPLLLLAMAGAVGCTGLFVVFFR